MIETIAITIVWMAIDIQKNYQNLNAAIHAIHHQIALELMKAMDINNKN